MPSRGVIFACVLIAAPFLLYLFQVGRRKQAILRFKVRRAVVSIIAYFAGIIVWSQLGHPVPESIFVGFLLGLASGFLFVRYPDRPRRIADACGGRSSKRDLKGEPFDPESTSSRSHHPVLEGRRSFGRQPPRAKTKQKICAGEPRMPHRKELLIRYATDTDHRGNPIGKAASKPEKRIAVNGRIKKDGTRAKAHTRKAKKK